MNFSKKNHEHKNNKLISVSKKVILCLAVIALFVTTSCKTEHKKEKEPVKTEKEMAMEVYQCPMDCENGKTYDKEGSCPVCKMDLKKVSKNKEDHSGHNH
jgi:uncharacterized paraquat-inducible protein A